VLSAAVIGSPWSNIVTTAVACLDTCVQVGKEHRDGRWPSSCQKCRVISRPHIAGVKTTANGKLNDRCRLATELLVTSLQKM